MPMGLATWRSLVTFAKVTSVTNEGRNLRVESVEVTGRQGNGDRNSECGQLLGKWGSEGMYSVARRLWSRERFICFTFNKRD